MVLGDAQDLESGVKVLQYLRTFAPYKYGGTWFIAVINGECHAHRSAKPLDAKASKAGVQRYVMAKVKVGAK